MRIKTYKKPNRPVFRNLDKYQVLPWREWIRTVMPAGHEGFVVQDLDLIVYRFGPLISINGVLKGMENVKNFLLGEISTKPYKFKKILKLKSE